MIFEQNGCGNGLLKNAPQLLTFFIKTRYYSQSIECSATKTDRRIAAFILNLIELG